MVKKLHSRRLGLLALLLGSAFAGLGYRLVDLQVLRHADLQFEARKKTASSSRLEPRRGDILDTRGNILATSVFAKTVCADPGLIGSRYPEVARALAPLLQMNELELARRLQPRLRQGDGGAILTNRLVVLKRKVPADAWPKIRDTMTNLSLAVSAQEATNRAFQAFAKNLRFKAVFPDPAEDQIRSYPNQTLAAHVLGFVRTDEHNDDIQGHWFETVGVDGIERALDSQLRGVRGWRLTERDKKSREVVSLREQDVEPCDGLNAVLTIDSVIQNTLETALAEAMKRDGPVSASGIIARPRTGEILALAVNPAFDPNSPGPSMDALRDRVIADVNEPGSTFKIVVVSGALNDHLVSLADQFFCENGRFWYAGLALKDHEPYGQLTVQGIIAKSSNIGAAKIGIQMGKAGLYQHILDFGFGARTGIALPGEQPGIVHSSTNWTKDAIAHIPMGQGIATTSLQMMMAMCAIANDGVLMRPMLINRLQDQDGNIVVRYAPQPVRRVISKEADHDMIQALKTVVTSDGTAPKAALEHYTVAGKTGTAQKPPYTTDKYYASFIGFFPADDPEICIYISMDEPRGNLHQGGQICAPVFKEVAGSVANYLNIRPDKDPVPAPAAPPSATNSEPATHAVATLSP